MAKIWRLPRTSHSANQNKSLRILTRIRSRIPVSSSSQNLTRLRLDSNQFILPHNLILKVEAQCPPWHAFEDTIVNNMLSMMTLTRWMREEWASGGRRVNWMCADRNFLLWMHRKKAGKIIVGISSWRSCRSFPCPSRSHEIVLLKNRKGFVRLALETKSHLVLWLAAAKMISSILSTSIRMRGQIYHARYAMESTTAILENHGIVFASFD